MEFMCRPASTSLTTFNKLQAFKKLYNGRHQSDNNCLLGIGKYSISRQCRHTKCCSRMSILPPPNPSNVQLAKNNEEKLMKLQIPTRNLDKRAQNFKNFLWVIDGKKPLKITQAINLLAKFFQNLPRWVSMHQDCPDENTPLQVAQEVVIWVPFPSPPPQSFTQPEHKCLSHVCSLFTDVCKL